MSQCEYHMQCLVCDGGLYTICKYRITTDMKDETEIITSIAASLINKL